MEIKLNNMLEVANLKMALENEIKWEEEYMDETCKRKGIENISKQATLNIYNQVKDRYKDYFIWKY